MAVLADCPPPLDCIPPLPPSPCLTQRSTTPDRPTATARAIPAEMRAMNRTRPRTAICYGKPREIRLSAARVIGAYPNLPAAQASQRLPGQPAPAHGTSQCGNQCTRLPLTTVIPSAATSRVVNPSTPTTATVSRYLSHRSTGSPAVTISTTSTLLTADTSRMPARNRNLDLATCPTRNQRTILAPILLTVELRWIIESLLHLHLPSPLPPPSPLLLPLPKSTMSLTPNRSVPQISTWTLGRAM